MKKTSCILCKSNRRRTIFRYSKPDRMKKQWVFLQRITGGDGFDVRIAGFATHFTLEMSV